MSGRHRATGGIPWGWISALVAVAALGGAGYAFRHDIGDALGWGEPAPSAPVAGPSPSLSPEPSPSPSPSPVRGRLVIHGTGDVNLDPARIPTFRARGYRYAWTGLDNLFRKDDLTIINLECSASTLGAAVPKEFNFRCDTAALPIARRFGVEVANQANNHSGDYGKEALLDSRRNIRAAGIAPVGTGKDARQAAEPALFELNGWKVAVLGFGGVVPEPGWIADEDRAGMADGDDIRTMVRAVRRAKRQADLVLVSIHWGIELDTTPRSDDVRRARAMIDAGADAIFGHHSHRLNPMDRYRGRPIFWGLGNFVWPALSEAGATTAVARVVVQPDGRITGKLLPAHIEEHGHPVLRD
jgi:poly-gamma-glutamate synthesis protein (capsule biosynthesis protein)